MNEPPSSATVSAESTLSQDSTTPTPMPAVLVGQVPKSKSSVEPELENLAKLICGGICRGGASGDGGGGGGGGVRGSGVTGAGDGGGGDGATTVMLAKMGSETLSTVTPTASVSAVELLASAWTDTSRLEALLASVAMIVASTCTQHAPSSDSRRSERRVSDRRRPSVSVETWALAAVTDSATASSATPNEVARPSLQWSWSKVSIVAAAMSSSCTARCKVEPGESGDGDKGGGLGGGGLSGDGGGGGDGVEGGGGGAVGGGEGDSGGASGEGGGGGHAS